MPAGVARAAAALRAGALVVYPTDTLFGLGARAADTAAVDRLLAAKGRPAGMPLSIAVSSVAEIDPLADLTPTARAIVRRSLPGPFTFLLPVSRAGRSALATPIVGPTGSVGIRVPDHPVARELARLAGPTTCTSANRHGRPPSRSTREARAAFGREVEVYVDLPPAPSGSPSTLVDLTTDVPRIVARS